MREHQFRLAVSNVPHQYAVFKVKRVPARYIVDKKLEQGDLMYWNQHRSQMVRVRNSMCLQVDPEHLDFVAYLTVTQMQEVTHVTNA